MFGHFSTSSKNEFLNVVFQKSLLFMSNKKTPWKKIVSNYFGRHFANVAIRFAWLQLYLVGNHFIKSWLCFHYFVFFFPFKNFEQIFIARLSQRYVKGATRMMKKVFNEQCEQVLSGPIHRCHFSICKIWQYPRD